MDVKNEMKHTRTFLIAGVTLIVIGIIILVIKGMSPEYVDAEGILHERFYLVIFGFFCMLCGALSCAVAGIKSIIFYLKNQRA